MAIVEIALRALSPGINDPHSAITCIDRLSEALVTIFSRDVGHAVICCKNDVPRLFMDVITVDSLLDTAFNENRQSAAGNVSVTVRLAEALRRLAGGTQSEEQVKGVRRHCDMLERATESQIREPDDVESIQQVVRQVRVLLGAHGDGFSRGA